MTALEAREVLLVLVLVWIADTAAYFVGRAWGRRKLAPAISPGKTWEGVYGGRAAGALYALAIVALAPRAGYAGGGNAPAAIARVGIGPPHAPLSVGGGPVGPPGKV